MPPHPGGIPRDTEQPHTVRFRFRFGSVPAAASQRPEWTRTVQRAPHGQSPQPPLSRHPPCPGITVGQLPPWVPPHGPTPRDPPAQPVSVSIPGSNLGLRGREPRGMEAMGVGASRVLGALQVPGILMQVHGVGPAGGGSSSGLRSAPSGTGSASPGDGGQRGGPARGSVCFAGVDSLEVFIFFWGWKVFDGVK